MIHKICTKCGVSKPLSDFSIQRHGAYGRQATCRPCWKIHYGYHKWSKRAKDNNAVRSKIYQRTSYKPTLNRQLKFAIARRPNSTMGRQDVYFLWENQEGRCALTGISMSFRNGTGKAEPTSVTLDRINNDGNYDVGNVRLICFAVNSFRGRMEDVQMVEMARAIVAHADTMRLAA
jgi:hypothetical protein